MTKVRLNGLIFIAIAAVVAWVFIVMPVNEALSGAMVEPLSFRPFIFAVSMLVFGVASLVAGEKWQILLAGKTQDRRQITFIVALFGVGFALGLVAWWLTVSSVDAMLIG